MELIILLVVVIIIGALLGGKSLGGTIRLGCGFLVLLIAALIFLFYQSYQSKEEEASKSGRSLQMIAVDTCDTYRQPDIQSENLGKLSPGRSFTVEDPDQYQYFYRLQDETNQIIYVRKHCLENKP